MIKKIIRDVKRKVNLTLGPNRESAKRILESQNQKNKSILFFTTRTCAPSYMNTTFTYITKKSDHNFVDYMVPLPI